MLTAIAKKTVVVFAIYHILYVVPPQNSIFKYISKEKNFEFLTQEARQATAN